MCSEKGFFPRILELRHFALHLQGEEVVGAEAYEPLALIVEACHVNTSRLVHEFEVGDVSAANMCRQTVTLTYNLLVAYTALSCAHFVGNVPAAI